MNIEDNENKKTYVQYKKLPLIALGISFFGLCVLTLFNNPEQGPVIIMIFLLLLFVGGMGVIAILVQFLRALLTKESFTWARLLYTSVALAAGAVFLAGLQTLQQLRLIDVVLVVVFELVLNFYLLRRF